MPHISANELKTKGVAAIEAALAGHAEAIVSVRGKDRFVLMDIAHYHYLRECELEAALAETRADLAAGRFVQESAQARHPDLRQQYLKTLQLLEANPFHPSLRLHALSGRLAGVHSVSINLSYRITLELLIQDERIIPVNVGDHDAVY
jgi:mRNA-degrading endonuclease YafQ of YafQ-DinJ toxin-antitoxin module